MKLINKIDEVRGLIEEAKTKNKIIGFVPTMGALHDGHLSLIHRASDETDFTIVSVFVNPIQFGPNEDFELYPRDINRDINLSESAGADIVFAPDFDEMLGNDLLTFVDISKMSENLCGANRLGHFKGVCTIVTKLFNIIRPDKAYFGKKDIQQLYIIKKMSQDLNFDIEIIGCKIIRENDGLAMSSRNKYLSENDRNDAVVLFNSIKEVKERIESGEKASNKVIEFITNKIKEVKSAKIDYVKLVNKNMENIDYIEDGNILALAVFINKTRLIDNHIIGENL